MDEDIFPESKEEQEDKDDSNMEWKKNGIDKHERLTLKVNVKEANLYNANKPLSKEYSSFHELFCLNTITPLRFSSSSSLSHNSAKVSFFILSPRF